MDQESARRKAQGRRLRQARIAAGLRSAREAALENEWPESTYRAHEAGTRTIGQDDAERYARRFHVSGQAILYGGDMSALPLLVPLLSWEVAENLVDAKSKLPLDGVDLLQMTDLGPGDFFALPVEDDSMDRYSPVGSMIVVNRADRELTPGRSYVASVSGDTLYRRWQPDPDRLEPHSISGSHQTVYIKRRRDLGVIGRVYRTVRDL